MYVITQRDALRDYYDLFVIRKEEHLTVKQLVEQAGSMSSKTTSKLLHDVFYNFSFDGNRFKLSDLDKLDPKYIVAPEEYEKFCKNVAHQIKELYPSIIEDSKEQSIPRTVEHLTRKIENGSQVLNNIIKNVKLKFKIPEDEIDEMISVGPYMSDFEVRGTSITDMSSDQLEERLELQSGSIKNLIYNLKERYSLSKEDLKNNKLTS